jgi:hypothetical protein
LGLAVVLPMLPVILTVVPIAEVLKALLNAARVQLPVCALIQELCGFLIQ